MKCPKCGKELQMQKKKVGVDENGKPILNNYAICRDCKKQWNLDKQKANKVSQKKAVQHKEASKPSTDNVTPAVPAPKKKPIPASVSNLTQQIDLSKVDIIKEVESANTTPVPEEEVKPPVKPRYGNVPSEKVRTKREKAVKSNYENMIATDPDSVAVKDRDFDFNDSTGPVYRGFRIVLGVLSLLAGGFFAYMGVKDGFPAISMSNLHLPGMVYLVLAVCMFLTGIILLISQKQNSVAAFLFPMFFSLAGTLYAFFFHDGTSLVLYCAIWCAALTALLLVITITSRFSNSDDVYEEDEDDDDSDNEPFIRKKSSFSKNKSKDRDHDEFFSDDDFDDDFDDDDDDFDDDDF